MEDKDMEDKDKNCRLTTTCEKDKLSGKWFEVNVPLWIKFHIKASCPAEAIETCENLLSVGWWGGLRRQGQLAFNDMDILIKEEDER